MIDYIETHLCEHCNLNCRGCSHFSPLAEPEFKDFDEFKRDMIQMAKLTNHNINTIRLLGGEPLLNPNFIDYFIFVRGLFPNSQLVLVSNGTLLKNIKDEDIDLLNNLYVTIAVSDYHIQIDREKFNRFRLRYFEDKNLMTNMCIDLTGSQDIQQAFSNCDMLGCRFIQKGRIFQCPMMATIRHFNKYFNVNIEYNIDDISINIYNHTLEEIEAFLKTPHQTCKYCNTIKRWQSYIPFGISKGDIHEWIYP